jgi:Bacterial PH domain
VARLRLLPGEKELVRLRPSPGAWLGRYLLAALWALWGVALLWGPLATQSVFVKLLLAVAGPVVVGAALFVPRRKYARLMLTVLAGAGCALMAVADEETGAYVGYGLMLAGLMAFLLTETDRRLRTYHLSNLRMLHHGGLWEKEGWTVHYDAVLDVDAQQGPLGRLLGYGTLEPVLQATRTPVARPTKRRKVSVPAMSDIDMSAVPRLRGVGRFGRARHLVTCFIQDATATEYLREEQQTARRVSEAIRAMGGANILR